MAKNSAWLPRNARVAEAIAWILAVLSLVITALRIPQLSPTIPTHFDINGAPDGWGPPVMLAAFPLIILVANAFASLIVHAIDPKHWNRPHVLDARDEQAWYNASARVCAFTQLECSAFCLLMQLQFVDGNLQGAVPLVVALCVVLALTIFALVRPFYGKKRA